MIPKCLIIYCSSFKSYSLNDSSFIMIFSHFPLHSPQLNYWIKSTICFRLAFTAQTQIPNTYPGYISTSLSNLSKKNKNWWSVQRIYKQTYINSFLFIRWTVNTLNSSTMRLSKVHLKTTMARDDVTCGLMALKILKKINGLAMRIELIWTISLPRPWNLARNVTIYFDIYSYSATYLNK